MIWLCITLFIAPSILFSEDLLFHRVIQEVRVEGLKHIPLTDIADLKLFKRTGQKLLPQDCEEDVMELYATGLFQEIETATLPSKNTIILQYSVKENPIIHSIQIKGLSSISPEEMIPLLYSKRRAPLNLRSIQKDTEGIPFYLRNKGYDLSKLISISYLEKEEALVYEFAEPKIEKIELSGLTSIKPFIVHREFHTQENSVFNSRQLRKDRERLIRLGYFSFVSPPQLEEASHKENIHVLFDVQERKINQIDLGLEQDLERVVGFLKMDVNHFLLDSAILSGKVQAHYENNRPSLRSYSVRYLQPWFMNITPVSFGVDAWTEFKEEVLSKNRKQNNLTSTKNKRSGADMLFSVPILREHLSLSTKVKYETVSPIEGGFAEYQIRSLAFGLNYTSIENLSNPKSGAYWSFSQEQGGNLGVLDVGGLMFYRTRIDAAVFFELSPASVFGIHGMLGIFHPYLRSGESEKSTFEQEEFDIGGASSLRGYKESRRFNSRKLLVNMEYRHDLSDSLQGIVFADIGNVFPQQWNLAWSSFLKGSGVGIRYFTPIGPLRFDLAWGEHLILHFALNQVF